jgi:hypothetical protein
MTTVDLESRITNLENRLLALEQLSKKAIRKKRYYSEAERSAIRVRLLAGQEVARKRREKDIDDITIIKPVSDKVEKPKKVVKTEKKKSVPMASTKQSHS